MQKHHQAEQLTLSNGIPVILQHIDSPVAATYWWVKTGSADENPKEAGFAHFLEHMLFKDAAAKETGKASEGQMARAIESLGGDINAYTSFDQTVYHVTCAATHWENVIDNFGQMAKPQKFLKSDFVREREVILEELRKNEDSPGRQLFQRLFDITFKKHPYGKPVIGYVKTLKAAKVGELEAFYKRNYVSKKMGLVLVGPVNDAKGKRRAEILKLLEKRFGAKVLPKKAITPDERVKENPLREKATLTTQTFDVKTPTLSISFRVPDLAHEDIPALDLLSGILGMGELSRLYQKLFYQTSLATEASGGLYVPKDPGMIYFQAEVDSLDKINPAAEMIFQELKRIADEGPTPEELARVLVNSESERLYATQTADGMAARIGFLKFIMGDLNFDQRYLQDLRNVDAAVIRETAKRYFDPKRMNAVVLVPKIIGKFDTSQIEALAEKILPGAGAIPKHQAVKKDSSEIPVEYFKLPSGIKVAYLERPQSHVFSIHASALGGLRLELGHPLESAEKDWGASYMMSMTWTKGTSKLDARAIAAIVEGSAAGMEGFSGRNSIGLQTTGLLRDWSKLSELFTDVLLDPQFPEDEIAHSKRIVEDAIRSIDDHTSQVASKLFLENLFEHHPYGKLTYGSEKSVAAMNQEKLKRFHRMWMKPERLVISVSGPVSRGHLDSWLKELDSRVRSMVGKSGDHGHAQNAHIQDEPILKAPRWIEKSLKREQVHILVGGLGTKVNADDRHPIRLMNTILGGQSGRLFIELREKKSLAYTVSPLSMEGIEKGYVGTYIASAPSKRDEAIAGIGRVLETLAQKGPTAAEMNRAKEFFLGRRAMDLQSDSSLAAHYGLEALYGLEDMTESVIIKRIRSITPKEIQAVCRKYLIEPHMVTSIVG